MKVTLIILLIVISWQLTDIASKLNKLIEISTPEYINVIPDEVITEKH